MGIVRIAVAFAFACMLFAGSASGRDSRAPEGVDPGMIDLLAGRDRFDALKISPTGEYLAATMPLEDKTILVVMRLETLEVTATANLRGNNHVIDFWWASNERVLLTIGEQFGRLETPRPTGELMALHAQSGASSVVVGYRAGTGLEVGSRIRRAQSEFVYADMVDPLPEDDRFALVSVWQMQGGEEQGARAERLDLQNGRRTLMARAPIARARFVTDHAGEVRFAVGASADNRSQTYYRAGADAEWILINDQARTGVSVWPLGFSADNSVAYLESEEVEGPNSIRQLDLDTLESTPVLRGEFANPSPIWDPASGALLGAVFMEAKPRLAYLDQASDEARLSEALQANFPGSLVRAVSATRDGKLRLLSVSSDKSPTDYYLFDQQRMAAEYLVGRRQGIDPERMARVEPFTLQARDGLQLHGYLTIPVDREARDLPLVVNPHGGPFNVADRWEFHEQSQLLAAAGFAVLRVNFRGSGGYGAGFVAAGYRQWGQAMQDDVTDATRWAIEQGIADPSRICIHGASYGAYSSLMGVAREPGLYRCAVGSFGVYDLPLLHTSGEIPMQRSGRNYLEEVLGSQGLEAYSPTRLADRIRVPVMLVAGGQDERAPVEHTRRMERALAANGVPVTVHVYPTEGHGLHLDQSRRDYAIRLLDFLLRHLKEGGGT